jgi:hypothetical protein
MKNYDWIKKELEQIPRTLHINVEEFEDEENPALYLDEEELVDDDEGVDFADDYAFDE